MKKMSEKCTRTRTVLKNCSKSGRSLLSSILEYPSVSWHTHLTHSEKVWRQPVWSLKTLRSLQWWFPTVVMAQYNINWAQTGIFISWSCILNLRYDNPVVLLQQITVKQHTVWFDYVVWGFILLTGHCCPVSLRLNGVWRIIKLHSCSWPSE